MPQPPELTRRSALAVGAAAAGSLGLAACGAASGAATPSAGGGTTGSTPTDGSGGSPTVLIATADVPVGGSASATDGSGNPVVVAQPKQGQFVAFSAVCTHAGCTVSPAGEQLQCPCHGSVFDAFTGDVVNGPAAAPLPPVSVTVDGDQVLGA